MVILLVFHAGDPGSIPVEGNIFSSSILFSPFFYILCNKSLVAFYIKFNALDKSSYQPLFFYKFSNPNRIIITIIGIGMPSPILWSHLQRIVLLSSLLWWELGSNSLITGPGEWLSFRRFTSKLSWSWSQLWLQICGYVRHINQQSV